MPAYIRTKNIFDAKVNILIDNIFFQKADESNAMMCVTAPLCLGYQNIPDTSSSLRNVMMTNCPLSSHHIALCHTSSLASIKYPIETVGKRTLRTPRRLKIVPIVIVILKHLIMALMKVFRVRE